MLSCDESTFQRLISAKRCELLEEKRRLGLTNFPEPAVSLYTDTFLAGHLLLMVDYRFFPSQQCGTVALLITQDDVTASSDFREAERGVIEESVHVLWKSTCPSENAHKIVRIVEPPACSQHATRGSKSVPNTPGHRSESRDDIPQELLRYMRRYSGLPPMLLKKGEFSPNNPLFLGGAGTADASDAFPGLGAYGERRERLRELRRGEYRAYLEQQTKKRNEPSKAERRSRPDLATSGEGAGSPRELATSPREPATSPRRLVEAGTQCERAPAPCVAVQTDGRGASAISVNANNSLTQAERELSPRTVQEGYVESSLNNDRTRKSSSDNIYGRAPPQETYNERALADDRPIKPNLWTAQKNGSSLFLRSDEPERGKEREFGYRRRSYDHARTERESTMPEPVERPKLRDLQHTYLPSFLDAELIRQRNVKAHQEAQERRRFYQQELKNQIQEQQRIREERKAREKLLEEAEMRKLEGQLRMLRGARDDEAERAARLGGEIHENGVDYDRQRNLLQRDIDNERAQAFRSYSQPLPVKKHAEVKTSKSDNSNLKRPSKLPFYYQTTYDLEDKVDKSNSQPFSSNVSDKSLFSPNYDLENYLRRSLNPDKGKRETQFTYPDRIGHKDSSYVPSFLRTDIGDLIVRDNLSQESKVLMDSLSQDSLPIPVMRHSPKNSNDVEGISGDYVKANGVSEAMKRVENKWQVPIVQKNILRTLPSGDGTNKNILTQLGSIRRQLQLEQLKLDEMLRRDPVTK